MKSKLILIICLITALSFVSSVCTSLASSPGDSVSRPNVSGGFDYYDPSGNKIGSSSKKSRRRIRLS